MDLRKFGRRAVALASVAFPKDHPSPELADSLIARLCEETGELARAVRRHGRERWGHIGEGPGHPLEVTDELGDVLFLVARIADMCGVDLEDAASHVLQKFNRRLEERRELP